MICISRRSSFILVLPALLMSSPMNMISPSVGSRSLSISLPVVDLPLPLSPTRLNTSFLPRSKLMPSTACTTFFLLLKKPSSTGKCFLRSLTDNNSLFIALLSLLIARYSLLLHIYPAPYQMPAPGINKLRFISPAPFNHIFTAWIEHAALRKICKSGDTSLDGLQPLLFFFTPWYGLEQPYGVGMKGGGKQVCSICIFYDLSGVHDCYFVSHLCNHPQIM